MSDIRRFEYAPEIAYELPSTVTDCIEQMNHYQGQEFLVYMQQLSKADLASLDIEEADGPPFSAGAQLAEAALRRVSEQRPKDMATIAPALSIAIEGVALQASNRREENNELETSGEYTENEYDDLPFRAIGYAEPNYDDELYTEQSVALTHTVDLLKDYADNATLERFRKYYESDKDLLVPYADLIVAVDPLVVREQLQYAHHPDATVRQAAFVLIDMVERATTKQEENGQWTYLGIHVEGSHELQKQATALLRVDVAGTLGLFDESGALLGLAGATEEGIAALQQSTKKEQAFYQQLHEAAKDIGYYFGGLSQRALPTEQYSPKEQAQLVSLQEAGTLPVKEFVQQFKDMGVRALLAAEGVEQQELLRSLLQMAEAGKADDAKKILFSFYRLVFDEAAIRRYSNEAFSGYTPDDLETIQQFLLEKATKKLVQVKQAYDTHGAKQLETALEKVSKDSALFATLVRELVRTEGSEHAVARCQDMHIEKRAISDMSEEVIDEMLAIYIANRPEYKKEDARAFLKAHNAEITVIYKDNEILAFVMLMNSDNGRRYGGFFHVNPEYQSSKIGTIMMDVVMNKEIAAGPIDAKVNPSLPVGIAYVEKLGCLGTGIDKDGFITLDCDLSRHESFSTRTMDYKELMTLVPLGETGNLHVVSLPIAQIEQVIQKKTAAGYTLTRYFQNKTVSEERFCVFEKAAS